MIIVFVLCFRYGNNGAAATMTLGRRGHYASLRAARTADADLPLLGPNQGQYATNMRPCQKAAKLWSPQTSTDF